VTSPLEVPSQGLTRVLADWSGVGTLYRVLATMSSDGTQDSTYKPFDHEWTAQDVERRAMRVLLLQCEPSIAQWPSSARAWRDQLPIISNRRRYWAERPTPRVDWSRTRKRGWPPQSFAIRRRHRASDQIPLAVLDWTLDELSDAVTMARQLLDAKAPLSQLVNDSIVPKLEVALALKDEITAEDTGVPSVEDLAAVRGMGWPWNSISNVAAVFAARYRRNGLEALARTLISPEGFPDRIFQLGVLGSVLNAAEEAGAKVSSLRPIADMTSGPVYRIDDARGRAWDLWCEAERCWDIYGLRDHYYGLASSLSHADGNSYQSRHLRPDILLALPGVKAVVIECKYPFKTGDPGYVAGGLIQAYFYGVQLAQGFPMTQALVAGPSEIVRVGDSTAIGEVGVGTSSPELIAACVSSALTDQ
jgi:hypothetical protein